MNVKLVAQVGEHEGREFAIDVPEFVIGRDRACQLRIDHAFVGRRQCRIVRDGGRVLVEDLGAATKTELNGRPVRSAEVRDGDRLRVGVDQFVFTGVAGGASGRELAVEDLARFDVSERGGVSVVRVRDRVLTRDEEINDFAEELSWLIEAGHDRVALGFGNVTQMSSQVIGALIKAHRQCRGAGGELKLFQVQPEVAAAFAITNLNLQVECLLDESQAVASTWPPRPPGGSRRRERRPEAEPAPAERAAHPLDPIPDGATTEPTTLEDVSISELFGGPPGCATDSFVAEAEPEPPAPGPPSRAAAPSRSAPPGRHVRLIALTGKAPGRAVPVRGPRFLIGRDPGCQLRARSQSVSRTHACIEQRDGRVFVRDLGSTNGTLVNDRKLPGEEVEVLDGDRLTIGTLQFTVAILPGAAGPDIGRPEGGGMPHPDPASREDEREGSWTGFQFTCAMQPGALVSLFLEPDLRAEPAPLRALTPQAAGPAPGARVRDGRPPSRRGPEVVLPLRSGDTARAGQPVHRADSPKVRAIPAPLAPPHELPVTTLEPPAVSPTSGGSERLGVSDDELEALLNDVPDVEGLDPLPIADPLVAGRPVSEPAPAPPVIVDERSQAILLEAITKLGDEPGLVAPEDDAPPPEGIPPGDGAVESSQGGPPQLSPRLEPRGADRAAVRDHPRPPRAARRPTVDRAADLFGRWDRLSPPQKTAGMVAVVLVALVGHWGVTELLRESPRARTVHAVEAVIRNQGAHLEAITEPSTKSQALEWMRRVGPLVKRQVESGARTEVKVVFQNGREAQTIFEARAQPGSAPSAPSPPVVKAERSTNPRAAAPPRETSARSQD